MTMDTPLAAYYNVLCWPPIMGYLYIYPRGVDSNIKMPGCACFGSESVPMLKVKKTCPYWRSSAHVIPILWCNIKLECIIPKCHSQSIILHKFLPILSDAANFIPILSEIFSLILLPWSRKRAHVLLFRTHTSRLSWNQVAPGTYM